MRIVDKYFESYLDGTISDQELKEFQDLLEDDPSLKTELAEVLEMRSQIHDDLLRIAPSEEYAGFVRSEVGALFEALGSTIDDEDDDDRAGGFFLSGRIIRSAAAGVIAIVLVALAPTLLGPGSGLDPISGPALTQSVQSQDGQSSGQISTSVENSVIRGDVSGSGISSETPARAEVAQAMHSSSSSGNVDGPADEIDHGTASASRVVALDLTVDEPAPSASIASADSMDALLSNDLTPDNRFLALARKETPNLGDAIGSGRDYADVQSTSRMFSDGNDLFASSYNDQVAPQSRSNDESNPIQLSDDDERQRIMFGGSLASGLSSKTSNVSLEGSAYMALGLSESSSIGLEGGSATFRYKKRVSYRTFDDADPGHFGKSNTEHESPFGDLSIGGTGDDNNSGGDAVGGGRENGTGDYEMLDGGSIVDEKMSSSGPRTSGSGGTVYASQPGSSPRYTYESLESEASMMYGLVFYDQKVASVNDRLNVHGRLGVGGTNGGLVLSAKAYAAISTHPNVAWTLGVGGSMLRDFANDIDFNATYGVNAGVEFGF